MSLHIVTYGSKNTALLGSIVPDITIDCTFLPNPWGQTMQLDGRDDRVKVQIMQACTQSARARLNAVLFEASSKLLEAHGEDRSLTIAFRCYGGKHRSVFVAETVAEVIRSRGYALKVSHCALVSR